MGILKGSDEGPLRVLDAWVIGEHTCSQPTPATPSTNNPVGYSPNMPQLVGLFSQPSRHLHTLLNRDVPWPQTLQAKRSLPSWHQRQPQQSYSGSWSGYLRLIVRYKPLPGLLQLRLGSDMPKAQARLLRTDSNMKHDSPAKQFE